MPFANFMLSCVGWDTKHLAWNRPDLHRGRLTEATVGKKWERMRWKWGQLEKGRFSLWHVSWWKDHFSPFLGIVFSSLPFFPPTRLFLSLLTAMFALAQLGVAEMATAKWTVWVPQLAYMSNSHGCQCQSGFHTVNNVVSDLSFKAAWVFFYLLACTLPLLFFFLRVEVMRWGFFFHLLLL